MTIIKEYHIRERQFRSVNFGPMEHLILERDNITLEFHAKNVPDLLYDFAKRREAGKEHSPFFPHGLAVYKTILGERFYLGVAHYVEELDKLIAE